MGMGMGVGGCMGVGMGMGMGVGGCMGVGMGVGKVLTWSR